MAELSELRQSANSSEHLECDFAVVGAGPAGLGAALTAAEAGLRVVLIDSGGRVGGQYWRHSINPSTGNPVRSGHHDWKLFLALHSRLKRLHEDKRVDLRLESTAWFAEKNTAGFAVHAAPVAAASTGHRLIVQAQRLLIATGAIDRQLPVPGWELPGVMSAGGVQAFTKINGFPPGKRILLAGTGPFLASVASGVADHGAEVIVCENARLTSWVPQLHRASLVPEKMWEGIQYAARLTSSRARYLMGTGVVALCGADRVREARTVRWASDGCVIPGSEQIWDVDAVGLGWGFTPQIELAHSLGAATVVGAGGALAVRTGPSGETSVPGLYAAGETTGIGGAMLALAEGERVGAAASSSQVRVSTSVTIARLREFAKGMHSAHPLPDWVSRGVPDSTVVCRCEDVTAGQIRAAVREFGVEDLRSAKSVTRAGMGPCQGRMCGLATGCLASGNSVPRKADLEASAHRTVAFPVELRELCQMDSAGERPL